jgi:hypothetical protein
MIYKYITQIICSFQVLGNRIGFLRRTHYGDYFEVKAKLNANNVAFTTRGEIHQTQAKF